MSWVDESLEFKIAQDFKHHTITPENVAVPSSVVDFKPDVDSGEARMGDNSAVSIPVRKYPNPSRSSTSGRKRAATYSASDRPVTKIKRPGAIEISRASITGATSANAFCQGSMVSNTASDNTASDVTHSLSGLFQIARNLDTPAQKAARRFYVAQVVEDLDEWYDGECQGTRTAFLTRKSAGNNVRESCLYDRFSKR